MISIIFRWIWNVKIIDMFSMYLINFSFDMEVITQLMEEFCLRISAKGSYAIAALIEIGNQTALGKPVSTYNIAEKLGVSKIFLEQTITLLKKNNLLFSTKGKNGGYRLARAADSITALDILFAVEGGLFEKTETAGLKQSPANVLVLEELIFNPLDKAVADCLVSVTLQNLQDAIVQQSDNQSFMLYI